MKKPDNWKSLKLDTFVFLQRPTESEKTPLFFLAHLSGFWTLIRIIREKKAKIGTFISG